MTVDLLDIGYDPDEDAAPPSHCPGPAYGALGGCGRFLVAGTWICPRCKAMCAVVEPEPDGSNDLPF